MMDISSNLPPSCGNELLAATTERIDQAADDRRVTTGNKESAMSPVTATGALHVTMERPT